MKNAPSDSCFVCFEDLCKSPTGTLKHLFEVADISLDEGGLNEMFISPPVKTADGVDDNLRNEAGQIYNDLCTFSRIANSSL